jgi:NAD(P)-dependent dehydrogenase (short-subunit alcohol dehydrogenase family)
VYQDMSGMIALVTGGGEGIGKAVAKQLALEGAHVVAHSQDSRSGEAVVEEIRALGGTARYETANLANVADVRSLAINAGPVDVLVNAANYCHPASTVETSLEVFTTQMAVNVRAPFLLVQELAPRMAMQGNGVIVNLTSFTATSAGRGRGVFGAAKAALELLTRTWADEFGVEGVRVNAVAAGPTQIDNPAVSGPIDDPLASAVVIGRAAAPDEIAHVVVFLCSAGASYINGAVVPVHGGLRALSAL